MGTSRNVVGTGTGLERAERDFRKMFGTTGTLEPEKNRVPDSVERGISTVVKTMLYGISYTH